MIDCFKEPNKSENKIKTESKADDKPNDCLYRHLLQPNPVSPQTNVPYNSSTCIQVGILFPIQQKSLTRAERNLAKMEVTVKNLVDIGSVVHANLDSLEIAARKRNPKVRSRTTITITTTTTTTTLKLVPNPC